MISNPEYKVGGVSHCHGNSTSCTLTLISSLLRFTFNLFSLSLSLFFSLSQGEWKPKQIDNPAYKGEWVHPEIDNPEYQPDPNLYKYEDFGVLGVDIWQVSLYTLGLVQGWVYRARYRI